VPARRRTRAPEKHSSNYSDHTWSLKTESYSKLTSVGAAKMGTAGIDIAGFDPR
jgi:hypothetical protein